MQEEDHSTDIHTQSHQADAVGEQTISTEGFDDHGDISSRLTTSLVARIDPPFSLSEESHLAKDPVLEQEGLFRKYGAV